MLFRREGIATSLYYSWSKELLEGGGSGLPRGRKPPVAHFIPSSGSALYGAFCR